MDEVSKYKVTTLQMSGAELITLSDDDGSLLTVDLHPGLGHQVEPLNLQLILGVCPAPAPAAAGVDEWRRGQQEVIQTAWILRSSGYRVFIDAPTGTGKSVIARGLLALNSDQGVVLTADHELQRQYEAEGMLSVTGRRNWPCSLETDKTAENAPCNTGELETNQCSFYNEGACAYFAQVSLAMQARRFVTNYQWYLLKRATLKGLLIVADEAHLAEKLCREHGELRLPTTPQMPALSDDTRTWRDYFHERSAHYRSLLNEVRQSGYDETEGEEAYRKHKRAVGNLLKVADRLSSAGGRVMDANYFLERDGNSLLLRPTVGYIDAYFGRDAIMMSATLGDPSVYLENSRGTPYAVIHVPCPFPVERRPVIYQPTVRVHKDLLPEGYDKLAGAIDSLLLQHSETKGVVHTASYAMAERLYERSSNQGMLITHDAGKRSEAIARFRSAPPGRLILSPSMTQGVDLPYDLCNWQVIAKLPFPNLGDSLAARRSKLPVGNAEIAQQIVQAAGRGMRAEDDQCTTYILDENFGWFYKRNVAHFPAWFREAVEWRLT